MVGGHSVLQPPFLVYSKLCLGKVSQKLHCHEISQFAVDKIVFVSPATDRKG